MLKDSVGSPVSFLKLAHQLEGCSPKTVASWIKWLERLYIVFRVNPYHRNISRSLKKMPKYYFYNWTLVKKNKGLMFENFIACSLLKENHFREDTKGEKRSLYYVRNKNKQEIDFLITNNNIPTTLIESKWSDDHLHSAFKEFSKYFNRVRKIQLVKELRKEKLMSMGQRFERLPLG